MERYLLIMASFGLHNGGEFTFLVSPSEHPSSLAVITLTLLMVPTSESPWSPIALLCVCDVCVRVTVCMLVCVNAGPYTKLREQP